MSRASGCEEDFVGVLAVDVLVDLHDQAVLDAEHPCGVGLVDAAVLELGPSRRLGEDELALCDQ